MNKKFKFGIAGILFTVANGTIFFVLRNNLNFFNSSRQLEQKSNTLRTRRESKGEDYKLDLDTRNNLDSSTLLDLKGDSFKTPELKLDVNLGKNDFSTNSLFENSSGRNHLDSIKDIFDEISREDQIDKFFKKVETEYGDTAKRHLEKDSKTKESMLRTFLEAQSVIQRWVRDGRKDISKALTRDQRVSLQRFYELFKDLTSQGQGFSSELDGIAEKDQSPIPEEKRPKASDISGILRKIQWTGNKILVHHDPTISWEKNIYKYFYNSEQDFKKHVDSVKNKEEKLRKLERSQAAETSFWGGYSRARDSARINQQRIKELKGNTQSEVEYQIGSKLLELIGKLN